MFRKLEERGFSLIFFICQSGAYFRLEKCSLFSTIQYGTIPYYLWGFCQFPFLFLLKFGQYFYAKFSYEILISIYATIFKRKLTFITNRVIIRNTSILESEQIWHINFRVNDKKKRNLIKYSLSIIMLLIWLLCCN